MKRLLAAIVVLALIGVAVAVASAHHSRGTGVAVTQELKRRLSQEIRTLRSTQPTVPPGASGYVPIAPAPGITCFVAGTTRCSEIPCRELAKAPLGSTTSTAGVTTTFPPRKLACPRAPRKVVRVSGP